MVWVVLLVALQAIGDAQPGWRANPELVKKLSERRPEVIYDEAKVPPYTLPDPLVCQDGTKVTTPELWWQKRRPEILELFRTHMYGRAPLGRPANLTWTVFDLDRNALGGKATRKQVRLHFTGDSNGPSMDLLIYLPNNAPRPVPVFLLLNFSGNHTVHSDPAIRIKPVWDRAKGQLVMPAEETRGSSAPSFPIDKILARSYGLATAYYGDIVPDVPSQCFKHGVFAAFDKLFGERRPPDGWGAISAWAWGLSRAMDFLESDPDVEAKKVAVLGHSCNREDDLPIDQHMLIALIAPRPVYVASADEDLWADPRGEFLAAKAADPVYKLLGTDDLPAQEMPPLNQPVMGTIGYHIRSGAHGLTEYDWERYIDFADLHFKKKRTERR